MRRERHFYEYDEHQIEVFRSEFSRHIKIDGIMAAKKRHLLFLNPPTIEAELDNMHILAIESYWAWPGKRLKVRINGRIVSAKQRK